ncbi:MAG: gliding motility-associated C-terminal domain-containing protein [Saprospiraceae bacterium]|nr:gliding motility-associated C-terminal domain-containing protein [Candidatus Vicinibacter affinis]
MRRSIHSGRIQKYDQAGVFVDTLNTINGCDSVINTRLIVDLVTAALTVDSIRCYDEQFGGASAQAIRGIPEFLFSFDDGRNFGKLNSVSKLPPGDYKVLIKDSLNCIDTQYFSLIVPIELETELENKIDITLGDKIILKPLLNFNPVTILWSPSDGLSCSDCLNPEVNILRSKNYTLTVTDRLGCTTTAIVQIRVDNNTQIWVPNVFSPNGDQQNDFVTVFGNHSIKQVDEFRIYDRWGNLVFLSGNFMVNDLQAGWDGNFKGEPVNPGVFVYYVKATRIDGTTVTLAGDVSVVK